MSKENNILITEEKLLGGLMKRDNLILDVIDKLNPELFSTQEYAHIYRAITDLYKEDITPDDISVLNRLEMCGHDIPQNLVTRIYSKGFGVVTKKQIKEYCSIISSSAFRRKSVRICTDFLEDVKSLKTPEEIIDKFISLGISLSDKLKTENKTTPIEIKEKDILDDIDLRIENPDYITGLPFGFKNLDSDLDGACEGEIITIGGESGSCKTFFALQVLVNMARFLMENGIDKKLLFISLEMTKKQLHNRLLGIVSGLNCKYFKKPNLYFIENNIPFNEEELAKFKGRIKKAVVELNSMPIVMDDSSELSADEIVAIAKRTQLKHGLACIFVDYAGLIGNEKENSWDDITETYRRFKYLTKSTLSPLIILNQYNNDVKENKKSGYKPNLYYLTGGKEPRNASHKIIHTWKPDIHADFIEENPDYANKIYIINDKNREGFRLMPDDELAFVNGNLVEYQTPKVSIAEIVYRDSFNAKAQE